MECEVTKVSTLEEELANIGQLPQPVGIVLFGADCDLKDKVYMECVEQIPNLATGYGGKGNMALRCAKQPFSEGRPVLTVMYGEPSGDHHQRHDTVRALRGLGARSVVGIYAKFNPIWLGNKKASDEDPINEQAWALLNHPPTADGLDCFIVV